MSSDKTKQKNSNSKTGPLNKPKTGPLTKPKKKEPVPLDDNILMLARELFKHISPLNLEINAHKNLKTIIINEEELNGFLENNIKLAQINEVKKFHLSLLDNDVIEMD